MRYRLAAMACAAILSGPASAQTNSGMMKMLFSIKSRRLLGVHILGEGATELIHIGQAVLNLKGTIDYFIDNTFNYPTLAEAYKIASLDAWNRLPKMPATTPA